MWQADKRDYYLQGRHMQALLVRASVSRSRARGEKVRRGGKTVFSRPWGGRRDTASRPSPPAAAVEGAWLPCATRW